VTKQILASLGVKDAVRVSNGAKNNVRERDWFERKLELVRQPNPCGWRVVRGWNGWRYGSEGKHRRASPDRPVVPIKPSLLFQGLPVQALKAAPRAIRLAAEDAMMQRNEDAKTDQ
jgi:hypothetical protein